MPKLARVRWLDNCYREGEHALEDLGTGAELTYYGLLVRETEVAVTLAMEDPSEGRTRNPFDILRHNILDIQVLDADRVFRAKRPRKAKKSDPPKPPSPAPGT